MNDRKNGIATIKEYGFFQTRYNALKEEINNYRTYKDNKKEVNEYLFKTNYGSECEACLEFTPLIEKEQFDGVCKQCFTGGKVQCINCGDEVYTSELNSEGFCFDCMQDNTEDFDRL